MAKTPQKTAPQHEAEADEESKTLVTSRHGEDLPAAFAEEMGEYAGAGISDRQEDFLLPFLYIAQSNSPQTKRQQADKYIPGLEAGDIFNTATGQFWKGETGVVLVPAYFQKAEVEWVTRAAGGGYVATHPIETPLRQQVVMGGEGNRFRMLPSGNQLVETSYHFCIVVESASPVVIGMTSTGLQTSRQWNTLMKDRKMRGRDGQLITAPSFSRAYRLRTAYRQNDQGDWFAPVIEDLGWAQGTPEMDDARRMGKEFYVQALDRGVQMGRPPETTADPKATEQSQAASAGVDGDEPPI